MRKIFVLFLFGMASMIPAPNAQSQTLNSGTSDFMGLVASRDLQSISASRRLLAEPSGVYSVQREMYKIPQEPGQRMMKVGKILTGCGAALVITGILVYNNRDPNYSTQGTYGTTYGDDPHEAGGALLVTAGTSMIVPGVLIWIHGSKKYRRHLEKTTQGLYVPAGKVGLSYRF